MRRKTAAITVVVIIIAALFAILLAGSSVRIQESWNPVYEIRLESNIRYVAISQDGKRILAVTHFLNTTVFVIQPYEETILKLKVTPYHWHDFTPETTSKDLRYIIEGSFIYEVSEKWVARLWYENKHVVPGHVAKFSSDGRFIVSGDSSGWVYLIGINGTEVWRRRVSSSSIDDVAISDDCRYVAATDGFFVYLLNSRDGNVLWERKISGESWQDGHLSFFSNTHLLCIGLSGYFPPLIGILDINGDWWLKQTKLTHHLIQIKTSKDLIFIADKEKVYVYNMRMEPLYTFEAKIKVNSFDCTPDGNCVVIGSEEMSVYLFEKGVKRQPTVKTLTLYNAKIITPPLKRVEWRLLWEKRMQEYVRYVVISPNAEYIVGSSYSKLIVLAKNGSKLWDADPPQIVDDIVPISVLDDGTCWITTLRGLDVVGIKEGKVICHVELKDLLGYFPSYGIEDVKISRDGKYILMSINGDGVRFYSLHNNKFYELWKWEPVGSATQAALSDDNSYVLISNGVVTLLRSNGSLVWERRLAGYITFIPFYMPHIFRKYQQHRSGCPRFGG